MDVPAPPPGSDAHSGPTLGMSRPLAEVMPEGATRVVVGLLGVASVVASFAMFGASAQGLIGAILCPALVLLAAIDIRHHLLPNAIIFPVTAAVGLALAAFDAGEFLNHLFAALALGGFLFVFAAVFPSGLGMGDAKLGFLLGLALGAAVLPAMMLAFLGVFFAALWILVRHGLSARKQTIPFGPFLAAGAIAAFFLT
jgi:leader peptidase (prepilin peptidase) / N-methyltransferase